MRKTEGRFRTWKSKKQWLFAGAVVTSLLLGATLVFGGLLGSLGGSSHQARPKEQPVSSIGDDDKSHKSSSDSMVSRPPKKDNLQPKPSDQPTSPSQPTAKSSGHHGNQPQSLSVNSQGNSSGQASEPQASPNQGPSQPLGLRGGNSSGSGHHHQPQGKPQHLDLGKDNSSPQPQPKPQGNSPKAPEHGLSGEPQASPHQGESTPTPNHSSGKGGSENMPQSQPNTPGNSPKSPEHGLSEGHNSQHLSGSNQGKKPLEGLSGERDPKSEKNQFPGLSRFNEKSPFYPDEEKVPYDHGFRDGYNDGYDDGYLKKPNKGPRFKLADGDDHEYEGGYNDGYTNGYNAGQRDRTKHDRDSGQSSGLTGIVEFGYEGETIALPGGGTVTIGFE
ncbi:TPA: KxYKxGKxW signal peptide domain-containing protein [Streptococcus equi subsp. zooepidemicus]|uniref:KxYKxGKxW signal peptide domain-containing protein n=1 Tax=Streptococcus equi TaxID=1336 RepID=UPI001E4FCD57|nr:KxYKxGKxW signal peptide domain-containing protein [Streptococcus equi]MCD3367408.1 KxYKxGKxW signal peptide domain-containing protein [Streptococcus equi subsp. zooepidemicus]MCD3447651.1 KxYKxGKxW signal peptide domain-containing protein [Streptococcus equi subsp. zooepidemicus]MCD3466949.1 KxYKxGKxW signal peptide domain-containing protein [Streptococcus equi subsp. zooepidemicus]HEL0548584.1 KxYKxGKxW signal peptide domain-containing protein [Streptococcus equi subsp. zooepidemicus]HEL0